VISAKENDRNRKDRSSCSPEEIKADEINA
jgi:hypothetical protein